jgi:Helix-turn-helix domain
MASLLDDYLTQRQAARELGKCFRTLIRWRESGVGPPVTRIGNAPRYRKEALRQWLLAQEVNFDKPKRTRQRAAA